MSVEQFVEKVARHLNSMSQNQKTITHLKPPSLELLIVKKED